MSQNNGVIRIGRKGLRKFAFGDTGPVFEIDVVATFQQWIAIDENFRPIEEDKEGSRVIPAAEMPAYYVAAQSFVKGLQGEETQTNHPVDITVAEALDFIARLREQYDGLAHFFRPKLREERASPDTSEVELRFSEETPAQN